MKKMKLSDLDVDSLSEQQKYELLTQGFSSSIEDLPKHNKKTAALILGATALAIVRRTLKAIDLYKKGYADYIFFSGGDGWKNNITDEELQKRVNLIRQIIPDTDVYSDDVIKQMTEAEFMKCITDFFDVPDEDIFWEYYSQNTRENFQNVGFLLSNKQMKENFGIERVLVVTDLIYARRAMLTVDALNTNKEIEFLCAPTTYDGTKEFARIEGEVTRLSRYSKNGHIRDAAVEIADDGHIKVINKEKRERAEIE